MVAGDCGFLRNTINFDVSQEKAIKKYQPPSDFPSGSVVKSGVKYLINDSLLKLIDWIANYIILQ